MVTRHTRGKVRWIDLESPDRQELRGVMQEFGIDARIEEEIAEQTPYPIVLSSPRYLYLILHFPVTSSSGEARTQEIDFVIGKNFVITARYESIGSIHGLHKVFEAEELLGLPVASSTADVLLERILRRLYGALREEVDSIRKKLDYIEEDIFNGKERSTVRTISNMNRILLRFDTTIGRHSESLSSLLAELSEPAFFGKSFAKRSAHIDAEREHVATLIGSYRDVATELRITNDSLLSASQNEVMKNLTAVMFIILPLSLVVALFQMSIPGVPFAHTPDAFWIVILLIAFITGFLIFFAKRRHWL